MPRAPGGASLAPGQDPLPADLAEGLKVGAGGERAVLEVPLASLVPVLPPQLQLRQGLRVPRLWERRGRGGHHASPSRSLYEALSAARAAPHTLRTGMVLIRSPRTRHMPAEVGLLSASLESICRASSSRPCSTKVVTWGDTKNTPSRRRLSSQFPQPALASSSQRSVVVPPSEVIYFIQPSNLLTCTMLFELHVVVSHCRYE